MSEGGNFLKVRTYEEFQLGRRMPMTLSVSYPLCIISFSSSFISVYNVETYTTIQVNRPEKPDQTVVICADISADQQLFVTGHSDGEIVIWSIPNKSVVFTTQTAEPVVQIAFLTSNSVIHSDSNGVVSVTTFTQTFFKKQISTTHVTDLQEPLSCLSTYKGAIYTSTSSQTIVFDLNPSFRIIWSDVKTTLLFSFLNDSVARVFGHTVSILSMDGKVLRTVDFSLTPVSIAIIDDATTLALFNGSCELAVGQKRFKRAAPQGLSKSVKDKVFIVGNNKINVVTLASIKDRVASLTKDNNWKDAFIQIQNATDIEDLQKLFIEYSKQPIFDPLVLFSTCERLKCQTMITSLPFSDEINDLIIRKFVENTKNWPLNRILCKKIINSSIDKNKITEFLLNSPLKMNFIGVILEESMEKLPKLCYSICYSFLGDIEAALEIAYSNNFYDLILESLNTSIVSISNDQLHNIGVHFIATKDLREVYKLDSQRLELLFVRSLTFNKEIQALSFSIISVISAESQVWDSIADLIIAKSFVIGEAEIPYLISFLIKNQNPKKSNVLELLVKQNTTDQRHLLSISRQAKLVEIEYNIIEQLGDVSELVLSLLNHKETSFCMHLRMTAGKNLQHVLFLHCRSLIKINPDEYAAEMWASNDIQFIKKVSDALSYDLVLHWHFLKRIFKDSWYCANADEGTILKYLKFLSQYEPHKVYHELMKFQSIPYDQLLPIVLDNGILDASLYACQMIGDLEKALNIATKGLLDGLMIQDETTVRQVTTFLCSVESHDLENMWMKCFACFQLPLYAFQNDASKMQKTIQLFSEFLKPMTIVIDPAIVSDTFTSLFLFIPFSVARPIIGAFFHAIRERNEFSGTLSNIKRDEALASQLNHGREILRGKIIDSIRCAKCHKLLGANDAYASKCGHVFHIECSSDGWCPICKRSFLIPHVTQTITPSKILELFDSNDIAQTDQQKHQNYLGETKDLPKPKLGSCVSETIIATSSSREGFP